jgi:hypothetical protein
LFLGKLRDLEQQRSTGWSLAMACRALGKSRSWLYYRQLPAWIEHDNREAPHKAPGEQVYHFTFKGRLPACVTCNRFSGERSTAFLETCFGLGRFASLRCRRDLNVFHGIILYASSSVIELGTCLRAF